MARMHTLSGQIAFRKRPMLAELPPEYASDRSLKLGLPRPNDDTSSKVLTIGLELVPTNDNAIRSVYS